MIARLDIRMFYGLLLISEKHGVGKSTLGLILAELVGRWNTSFPSEQDITDSQFNDWIPHKRLVVVAEIYAGKSWKAYNRLKAVMSDEMVRVNEKNVKKYDLETFLQVFAASNSLRALKLDDTDRRWFVPEVTEELQSLEYWREFHAWLRGDGLGIILHWAHEWLSKNDPVQQGQHAPDTARKREIIEEGRSQGYRLAFDLAERICAMKDPLDPQKVQPVVVAVDEVRSWVASQRGIRVSDSKLERGSTLQKAMHAGGLRFADKKAGERQRRFTITRTGTYGDRKFTSAVMANFQITADDDWDKIKAFYQSDIYRL